MYVAGALENNTLFEPYNLVILAICNTIYSYIQNDIMRKCDVKYAVSRENMRSVAYFEYRKIHMMRKMRRNRSNV